MKALLFTSQALISNTPCSAAEKRWKQFTCMTEVRSLVAPLPNLISGPAAPREGALLGAVLLCGALCAPFLRMG